MSAKDINTYRANNRDGCRWPLKCDHPRKHYYCSSCDLIWFNGWLCPSCHHFGVVRER